MIPSKSTMYLNAAAYDTKANKISKKYTAGDPKSVKIACCKTEDLV